MLREHLRIEAPRGLLVPSDFQSMGYGVPAAIGAALAAPERRVVAIVGDGGLMMSGLELATAVREGLNLCVIVFRDGYLGQIRSQQARSGIGEASVTLPGVDLACLAKATGAGYCLLESQAGQVFADALQTEGVTLVDVPLASSPAIEKERKKGAVRQKARQALGPGGVDLLRRLLRR
jgi:acetolactate synthase-1/2/3 large subunit